MKINYTNKTIELTKKEYKEATVFGSDMYTALKEARTDFPTFKIITKEPTKKEISNRKNNLRIYEKVYSCSR